MLTHGSLTFRLGSSFELLWLLYSKYLVQWDLLSLETLMLLVAQSLRSVRYSPSLWVSKSRRSLAVGIYYYYRGLAKKGPWAVYFTLGLKQGGGPTLQASLLGTIQTRKAVQIMRDIVG